MPRTTRTRRVLPALLGLTLLLGLTAPAVADGYGSVLGDDQGTHRGDGVGPAIPGLAFVAELPATEFNGSHGAGGVQGYSRPVVVDASGHVLVQLDDTTADTDDLRTDNQLVAVDTTTGEVAWKVDDVHDDCPVVSGPDGRIWAMASERLDGERVLVSIDPDTGATTTEFEKATGDDTDPALALCAEAPMRLSADGTKLIAYQEDIGRGIDRYLRVFDISGDTVVTDSVIAIDGFTQAPGVFGEWVPELRVAPAGAPGEGAIYLFEQTAGVDPACCGEDDVNSIHAVELADLPATGSILDPGVIDRTVELGVSQLWSSAIVVLDDMLYVSGEESLAGRVPADGNQVNARNFRVEDDGADLELRATSLGRTPATARQPGDHDWHFTHLGAGDGETLAGVYRGTSSTLSGMDATSLDPSWDTGLGCFQGSLVVDAEGTSYARCDDGVVAVRPSGHVPWIFPLHDDTSTGDVDEGVAPFVDGDGSYDLGTLQGYTVVAVTDEGRVVLTASTRNDASYSGVAVVAIDLGTAVERAAGTNRLETAVDISRTTYPGGAGVVVLAKAGDYPDALAGAPLALSEGGPLLLTATDALSDVTRAEIDRLGATRAVLLGGEAALSAAVASTLEGMDLEVERVEGTDRYDTARLVADRIGATEAVVVEGANADPLRGWPDAVAASSWAASTGRAILLVTATRVPDPTASALGDMTAVTVVGGEGAVPNDVYGEVDDLAGSVERIAGASRYETSAQVAARSVADGSSLDVVWLTTGTGFADALTAGPAAALTRGVLLLVHGSNPDGGAAALDFLRDNADDVGAVFLVGGEGAISADVAAAVDAALGR